jgi:hypothetical protein
MAGESKVTEVASLGVEWGGGAARGGGKWRWCGRAWAKPEEGED